MDRKIALQLLAKRGVVSVITGRKFVHGKDTGTKAIVVGVIRKVPESQLRAVDIVPHIVDGQLTDVIQVGEIKLRKSRTDKWRPAPGGVSVGHFQITAGTLGAWVLKNGKRLILSNNHVLADVNKGVIGDDILQPGAYDGGTEEDVIAHLHSFVPISMLEPSECGLSNLIASIFNGIASLLGRKTRLSPIVPPLINKVDCALAEPISPDVVSLDILDCGIPQGIAEPALDMLVKKSGRTSETTHERISGVDGFINVNMGDNRMAMFEDQFAVSGEFSGPGDSGSVILTEHDDMLVGLLFAGGEGITYCSRYSNVVKALGLDEGAGNV